MTAEEFERCFGFRPSQFVLDSMNDPNPLRPDSPLWKFDNSPLAGNKNISYRRVVSRSSNNLTYEFCNKKLQDNVTAEGFIFDIDGQLIYIDVEE